MERNALTPVGPPPIKGLMGTGGFSPKQPGFKKAVYSPTMQVFRIGDDANKVITDKLFITVLLFRSGLRKNFESVYDPKSPANPTCFSFDGENGSAPRIERMLRGQLRPVYGECGSCFFARFGSAQSWKTEVANDKSIKAPNCANYALLLGRVHGTPEGNALRKYEGEVIMVQIPPTGATPVGDGLAMNIASQGYDSLWQCSWKLLGSGGGKEGKYMSIVMNDKLSDEEGAELEGLAGKHYPAFEETIKGFLEGAPADDQPRQPPPLPQPSFGSYKPREDEV